MRCSKCKGNKTYFGMGYMPTKCEVCGGTGEVEPEFNADLPVVDVQESESQASQVDDVSIVQKPKRKSRAKSINPLTDISSLN